jgi:hypothetical protein
MSWEGKTYVTAANPAPGQMRIIEGVGPDKSGNLPYAPDYGVGVNVYIAGGMGPLGSIPVSQTNPVNISLSGVTIGGVIEVTTSQGHPVGVSGTVFVENFPAFFPITVTGALPVTGVVTVLNTGVFVQNWPTQVSGVYVLNTASVTVTNFPDPVTSVTMTLTGVLPVSQTNLPATQSVYVVNQTSGSVTVSGTASVSVTNFPSVVTVTGTGAFDVTVLNPVTGVNVLNFPVTQSVFVVNQGTSSFAGDVNITASITLPVSQTNPVLTSSVNVLNWPATASVQSVTGTVAVSNLPVTQTVSGSVGIDGPVAITGVVTATLTGALSATITNLPATQSVYVVNQVSSSTGVVEISGVNVVSGALQVTVSGLSFSGASDVNINGTTISNNYSIDFPTASLVLLPANAARKNFTIFNDSDQNLLVRFGPTASLVTWTFNLYPQHYYEPTAQVWKGDVSCIGAASGSGALQVEEMFL